jgi:hypothetical protein
MLRASSTPSDGSKRKVRRLMSRLGNRQLDPFLYTAHSAKVVGSRAVELFGVHDSDASGHTGQSAHVAQ